MLTRCVLDGPAIPLAPRLPERPPTAPARTPRESQTGLETTFALTRRCPTEQDLGPINTDQNEA
jgi:hypothetical protein